MACDGYKCLKVRLDGGVAFVTIDHPPINLFDWALIGEMDRIGRELEADPAVRVVVFDSADPDFFIAHADVNLILSLPEASPGRPSEPNVFQQMVDRFRSMPKATLAKIEGICRGGGSEFVLSLDMRFASLGKAVLGQPEVAVGIIPGGSGTQRLPRLMGRGRALEVILGCEDFPADLAERYGYVNRALPPDELTPFVGGHYAGQGRGGRGGASRHERPHRGGAAVQSVHRDPGGARAHAGLPESGGTDARGGGKGRLEHDPVRLVILAASGTGGVGPRRGGSLAAPRT
jgi:enoyl-CoA hydratase/carnithine racemase